MREECDKVEKHLVEWDDKKSGMEAFTGRAKVFL